MALKIELPKDFKPSEVESLKKEDRVDTMYWVYPKDSAPKKYGDASAEETYQWAKILFEEFPLKDSSKLDLMVIKSTVLDLCLGAAIFQYRNLFGGPELWDTFDEWERASKLTGKDKKKND